jgi:hypothetical protein
MRITALIPIVIFLGILVVVGLRLLSLWWRTRQLPELCLGLGITAISTVGMPLSVLGRMPSAIGTRLGDVAFAVGLSLACGGIALLFAFTWRVFRAEAPWARLVMVAVCLGLAVLDAGLIQAASQGSTLGEVVSGTRPWAVGIVSMTVLSFAWGGFEAMRYFRLLRRRQALGLADAVVTHRFLLWTVADWTAVVLCGSVAGFLLAGRAVLVDPLSLCAIALAGTVMSVTWYLTFFPPAAYVRYVGRGQGEGAGD